MHVCTNTGRDPVCRTRTTASTTVFHGVIPHATQSTLHRIIFILCLVSRLDVPIILSFFFFSPLDVLYMVAGHCKRVKPIWKEVGDFYANKASSVCYKKL